MKYLPIQINKEWCLKSENDFIEHTKAWYDFEKEAIATAKPIINHDGREWYDSSELIPLTQMLNNAGQWFETSGIIQGHHNKQRQVWKYICEKPVVQTHSTNSNKILFNKGKQAERTRIIGIIQAELKKCPSKYFNLYEALLNYQAAKGLLLKKTCMLNFWYILCNLNF